MWLLQQPAPLPTVASQRLLHVFEPSTSPLGQLLALSWGELRPQQAWLRWPASPVLTLNVELLLQVLLMLVASIPLAWVPLPSPWPSSFPHPLLPVVEPRPSWCQPLPQLQPFFLPPMPQRALSSSPPAACLSELCPSHKSPLCPAALLRSTSEPRERLFAASAVRRSPSVRSSLAQSAFAASWAPSAVALLLKPPCSFDRGSSGILANCLASTLWPGHPVSAARLAISSIQLLVPPFAIATRLQRRFGPALWLKAHDGPAACPTMPCTAAAAQRYDPETDQHAFVPPLKLYRGFQAYLTLLWFSRFPSPSHQCFQSNSWPSPASCLQTTLLAVAFADQWALFMKHLATFKPTLATETPAQSQSWRASWHNASSETAHLRRTWHSVCTSWLVHDLPPLELWWDIHMLPESSVLFGSPSSDCWALYCIFEFDLELLWLTHTRFCIAYRGCEWGTQGSFRCILSIRCSFGTVERAWRTGWRMFRRRTVPCRPGQGGRMWCFAAMLRAGEDLLAEQSFRCRRS